MTRLPLADRTMKARREGTCPLCSSAIRTGQYIARCGTTWYHASCVVRQITVQGALAPHPETTTKETDA